VPRHQRLAVRPRSRADPRQDERSRYFDPNAPLIDYSIGSSVTNLQSDLYWRYIRATGVVKRELAASSPTNGLLPQARQLYRGWIAGYNAYLRSGKLRDPTRKGKPWVRPITLTDMLLRGVQFETEASSQQFVGDIVQTVPPSATTAGARTASPVDAVHGFGVLERQLGDRTGGGSNGSGSERKTPAPATAWCSPTRTAPGAGPIASGWPSWRSPDGTTSKAASRWAFP
jgi:acyl-homoserine-lactone acylase